MRAGRIQRAETMHPGPVIAALWVAIARFVALMSGRSSKMKKNGVVRFVHVQSLNHTSYGCGLAQSCMFDMFLISRKILSMGRVRDKPRASHSCISIVCLTQCSRLVHPHVV